jgi:hypothetical protein
LDSRTLDKLLFTNLIFLASKLEVPMINKKWSFLQARKLKKWLNLKENNKKLIKIKKFYLKSVHVITAQHKLSRAFQTDMHNKIT